MKHIVLYGKSECSLCDDAETLLKQFYNRFPFLLERRDIYSNDKWLREYFLTIPVIEVEGRQLSVHDLCYETVEKLLKGDVEKRR